MPSLATRVRDAGDFADHRAEAVYADQPRYAATTHAYDTGLLLLRLVVGLTMAVHGAQKLFGIFDGAGISGTAQQFAAVGYPVSHVMAVIAGLCEAFGGLGLALGLLTPLAGAAVVGDMINAVAVKWGGGFLAPNGFEYELVLTVAAASIALAGPGRYALDAYLPVVRSHRLGYGLAAVGLAAATGAVFLIIRG